MSNNKSRNSEILYVVFYYSREVKHYNQEVSRKNCPFLESEVYKYQIRALGESKRLVLIK